MLGEADLVSTFLKPTDAAKIRKATAKSGSGLKGCPNADNVPETTAKLSMYSRYTRYLPDGTIGSPAPLLRFAKNGSSGAQEHVF